MLLFSGQVVSDSLRPHGLIAGFPVLCHLPELAQTHVHRVGEAIQLSHPLLSPSPPALNLSQHQGLFWWISSLNQVARVLELQLQHQSFQWIFRVDFLQVDWFDLFPSMLLYLETFGLYLNLHKVFPDSSVGKESTCNAGGPISIPRLGRSSGEGKAYPLQYSGLKNSKDCIVHGEELDTTEWLSLLYIKNTTPFVYILCF